jgi:hypothetical protein
MSPNYLKNIAIVGAGGQFGKHITQALVDGKKHRITAITRANSDAKIPEGVHDTKRVDYESHSSLVEALKGQEALIITVKVGSGDAQARLINATKDAGIQWIMPNEYGIDPTHDKRLGEDTKLGAAVLAVREQIEKAGLFWVGLSCGFWYEFSLAGQEVRYGFDFSKKTLTLFDDGDTKIPTSTWPLASLTVAKIFALPIQSDGKYSLALSDFKNKSVYVSSFFVSQRDMLASVLRVTGDKESDWTITTEASKPRYDRAVKMLSEGKFEGFAILLYTRVFFPDGASDYTSKLNNKDLSLPEENLDDATKTALEMAKVSNGRWTFHW